MVSQSWMEFVSQNDSRESQLIEGGIRFV